MEHPTPLDTPEVGIRSQSQVVRPENIKSNWSLWVAKRGGGVRSDPNTPTRIGLGSFAAFDLQGGSSGKPTPHTQDPLLFSSYLLTHTQLFNFLGVTWAIGLQKINFPRAWSFKG